MLPGLPLSIDSASPAFSFDVNVFGPHEDHREHYFDLLSRAESFRLAGKHSSAKLCEKEAKALCKLKWKETIHNLVTTVGKNDLINQYFKGSAYTANWYMLLKGTGSISASDTLASHAGWSESTPYAGNRPAITFGTSSAGSNTASTVAISINATATVAGAGICSVNTGTSGILYSAADFATARGVASGDTMNITPTVSFS